MLLFVKPSGCIPVSQIIIPLERVYNIVSVGRKININYDSGEVVYIENSYEKKIDTVSIDFVDDDEVNKILRQFYKAVNNQSNAFYFGTL